jgi:hypothetical protein
MSQDQAALIEKVRALPDQIAALVDGLTPEQLTTHYLDGEWTVAQNVHHLADSHMNSYVRCKLMATEVEPIFRPYDQDLWAELSDAKSADLSVSMLLLRSLHGRWVLFWESLSDEEWQCTGFHPDDGPVTLAQQLQLYADHGEAHIDQITRTLAAQP